MYPGFWDADQLYNLNNDIFEQKNLADQEEEASKLEEMKAILTSYIDQLPHTFGEFSSKQ